MTKREDILNQLTKHGALSVLELELLNDIPYSTIRARIADLRKKGYEIKKEDVLTGKYVLHSNPLLKYIKDKNVFSYPISISRISKELNTTEDDIKKMLSKLFESYDIIQLSSDSVIIKER